MVRAAWRLSGYRVEELIGAGASGEVWRARVPSTGVPVALKRIWVADREQRDAALSEAAMLSELDHPHLMKLHDVRHTDDEIVLVLDLAAGGSLASLLARRGRLTVGETITALAPIGAALAYAHTNGVVHGDVSAANVLFTDIGLPLLADLGVARLLGRARPVRTTPCYIDPIVAEGAVPGAVSDVFMLGAVALHALTGAPPWPGTDPHDVIDAALTGDDPGFGARLRAEGVPPAVADVVARALQIEPDDRGTAAEFALELRHAAEPVAVELAAGRTPTATAPGADSWPLQTVPPAYDGTPSPPVRVPPFARQPLTHGVRAPEPFGSAGPPGRHLARGARPRVAAGLVATVVAVAALTLVIGAAVVFWPWNGGSHHRNVARSSPAAHPTSAAVSPTAHDTSRPAQLLAGLDAARSRAFARRDPALLAGVYASSALLARDRALLTSVVPAGCGLVGVRSSFTAVALTAQRADRLSVRAVVSVAPSTVMCGGHRSGTARGAAATAMTFTLVRGVRGYRILSEHPT